MSDEASGPRGFQFPGEFEIKAMGEASAGLERLVPALMAELGHPGVPVLASRESTAGTYLSVTVRVYCATRAELEAAHAHLRAHPAIRWTL
jgi:putative lipoic acid-binding regulatory protein